jgi:hypothetical protein
VEGGVEKWEVGIRNSESGMGKWEFGWWNGECGKEKFEICVQKVVIGIYETGRISD